MTSPLPPAILIMGPTASGKTGLAVELVRRFALDIISVDSALVYRGMDIGTAKPDAATLAAAPHRLVDIRNPSEPYSAADFREDALREMNDITASGRAPLLVGGTMLYFRALLDGLSELPSADPDTRKALEERAAASGWAALHAELAKLDPAAAGRINPNDPQRIQRALEVIELTGRPFSEVQEQSHLQPLPYRTLKIVVCPASRQELHCRIEQRFDQMLAEGFLEEITSLHGQHGLNAGLPAMRAVGYRQGWAWLEGEYSKEKMREKAIIATRQLAKRQLTWLRRESACLWYDLDEDKAQEMIISAVKGFLEV